MMADARFTEPDVERPAAERVEHRGFGISDADLADGDVQIVDMTGYTMRHIAYVSVFVLRVYMKFLQEAYPSRLRAMHIINCPSILDRMMSLFKPFIREDVYQMVTKATSPLPQLITTHIASQTDQLPHRRHGQLLRVGSEGYATRGVRRQSRYSCRNQAEMDAGHARKNVSQQKDMDIYEQIYSYTNRIWLPELTNVLSKDSK